MKKLVALFLVIGFIAFLFGCSSGNSSPYITLEDISETKSSSVNANGQLEKQLSFVSGARLETTEDNTLAENVVVNVTETKSYEAGLNPIGKPEFIYVYGITAVLEDSLGNRPEVKYLEKPLTLTLPASHLGTAGICYAGVREDKSSPWKYTRLSESGVTVLSQRSIRAAGSGSIRSSYEFSLYKMGIEIALFAYNKPPEEAQKDISGAGITAAPVTPLLTLDENGNYCDNLDMDIKLEGDNLSSLSDSDITVSIIYRSNKRPPEEIKINGMPPVNAETRSDAAVSGENSYVHVLTLNKDNFKADFGGETSVKFSLDLKGKSSSDFPTDFIVEVSSVDNIENLIPFTYSNNVSYKAEAVYSITYNLDGGSLAEGETNPDRYTAASDTFTLKNPVKEGYAFAGWTGTGLSSATMVVTIEKGSTGSREYKAIWMQNAPDTYKLTVLKGTGIATVSEGGTYEAGKEITLAYTLENGYQSALWTSDDVSVDEAGKFIMPEKNVTVTANAGVITYNITYAGREGATFASGVTNPKTYDVSSDTITLNNPSKTGYEFVGWTGTGIASGTASMTVTIPQGSTGDREYTANWATGNYTITYDLSGGALAEGVTNPESYDITSADITLNNPSKAGYAFKGWSGTGLTGDENQTVTIAQGSTGDKTYTANWTPVSYTITYNLDGGSLTEGITNPVTYDVTSATITLNNPARGGDDFLGWTGTGIEDGTASMTVTIPAGSTGDRAYTANWRAMASVMTFTLPGGIELEMRRCPAGSFVRSGRDVFGEVYGDGNTVTITRGFYMGTYEVTNAQYAAIMGSSPSSSRATAGFTGDSQPVVCVSWNDITDPAGFIAKMNTQFASQLPAGYKFALPTEAQWEYACRAGTTTDLNSGKDIANDYAWDPNTNEVARYRDNWGGSNNKTHDVGGLASNSFGLYDMHGNVFEWCADWYGDYSSTDLTDPTGPADGSYRVMRGGCWGGNPCFCASWFRSNGDPGNWYYEFGFRLALVPVQE